MSSEFISYCSVKYYDAKNELSEERSIESESLITDF